MLLLSNASSLAPTATMAKLVTTHALLASMAANSATAPLRAPARNAKCFPMESLLTSNSLTPMSVAQHAPPDSLAKLWLSAAIHVSRPVLHAALTPLTVIHAKM